MSASAGADWWWPDDAAELVELQPRLGDVAVTATAEHPWQASRRVLAAGCFVAFVPGDVGPGKPGDRGWAAAVVWPVPGALERRRGDHHLRRALTMAGARQADDVTAQAVATGRALAAYVPGLLALREGPLLSAAVQALRVRPDVVLVDATGRDHPRRAGLALHLGAVTGLPTVGVTRRPLVARGDLPTPHRGATAPVRVDSTCVGYWVCTRSGVQPVVAHAAWRTTPETAAEVVLATSTESARTPVPLHEARRVAREARSLGREANGKP